MDPKATKTFHQHVQIQIECLISGAKMRLKQTQKKSRASKSRQTNERSQQSKQTPASTAASFDCPNALKWLNEARNRANSLIGLPAKSLLPFGSASIESDPSKQMAEIHSILAQCERQNKSLAERQFETSVSFASKSQVPISADIYLDYADILAENRQTERAIKMLERSVELEKGKIPAGGHAHQLGRLHLRLARMLGACKAGALHVEAAIGLEPRESRPLVEGAQLAYDWGQPKRSELLYEKALRVVEQRLAQRKFDTKTKEGREEKRKLSSAHVNYGAILQVNGKLELAAAHYRRALDCDPNNAMAATNLRSLLRKMNKQPRDRPKL